MEQSVGIKVVFYPGISTIKLRRIYEKLNWLVGTLAATVVILGTAFGIHSVQAADSESKAASDMVFEDKAAIIQFI